MVADYMKNQNAGNVDQALLLMLEGGEVEQDQIEASYGVENKKKNKKIKKSGKKVIASNKPNDASHKSLKNPGNNYSLSSKSKHEETMKQQEYEIQSKIDGEKNYKML